MIISNNQQYKQAIGEVYVLMNKGEKNINDIEAKQIEDMAKAIEYYEDHILKLMPIRITVNTVVQQKATDMDITQKQLAEMLGIGTPKLSQILNGKRPPDVHFLKAVHEKLGIDGNFILEAV